MRVEQYKPRKGSNREVLANLGYDQSVIINCRDQLEKLSWASAAYQMQLILGCSFICRGDGLKLTITKYTK